MWTFDIRCAKQSTSKHERHRPHLSACLGFGLAASNLRVRRLPAHHLLEPISDLNVCVYGRRLYIDS